MTCCPDDLKLRKKKKKKITEIESINISKETYQLKSLVIHYGKTVERGHYWVNYLDQGTWVKIDDDKSQTLKHIEKYEQMKNTLPYILFYEKVKRRKLEGNEMITDYVSNILMEMNYFKDESDNDCNERLHETWDLDNQKNDSEDILDNACETEEILPEAWYLDDQKTESKEILDNECDLEKDSEDILADAWDLDDQNSKGKAEILDNPCDLDNHNSECIQKLEISEEEVGIENKLKYVEVLTEDEEFGDVNVVNDVDLTDDKLTSGEDENKSEDEEFGDVMVNDVDLTDDKLTSGEDEEFGDVIVVHDVDVLMKSKDADLVTPLKKQIFNNFSILGKHDENLENICFQENEVKVPVSPKQPKTFKSKVTDFHFEQIRKVIEKDKVLTKKETSEQSKRKQVNIRKLLEETKRKNERIKKKKRSREVQVTSEEELNNNKVASITGHIQHYRNLPDYTQESVEDVKKKYALRSTSSLVENLKHLHNFYIKKLETNEERICDVCDKEIETETYYQCVCDTKLLIEFDCHLTCKTHTV